MGRPPTWRPTERRKSRLAAGVAASKSHTNRPARWRERIAIERSEASTP
jgi:hypothetical protein